MVWEVLFVCVCFTELISKRSFEHFVVQTCQETSKNNNEKKKRCILYSPNIEQAPWSAPAIKLTAVMIKALSSLVTRVWCHWSFTDSHFTSDPTVIHCKTTTIIILAPVQMFLVGTCRGQHKKLDWSSGRVVPMLIKGRIKGRMSVRYIKGHIHCFHCVIYVMYCYVTVDLTNNNCCWLQKTKLSQV